MTRSVLLILLWSVMAGRLGLRDLKQSEDPCHVWWGWATLARPTDTANAPRWESMERPALR